MQKFVNGDAVLKALFGPGGKADWVLVPSHLPEGSPNASDAKHHGDFDDDRKTVLATLAHIVGRKSVQPKLNFTASLQSKPAVRRHIDQQRDFALTR